MRHTFSIAFHLKRHTKSCDKQFLIIARITINGQRCSFSTQLKCYPDVWNIKEYRVEGKSKDALFINDTLNSIKVRLNQYLKETAELCGINKRIAFHTARHTCATTIALSNDIPMERVAKLLGHKNIRTTQLYARITDMKLNADMELLEEKLTGIRFK